MYAGRFLPGTDYIRSFRLAVDKLISTKMPVAWRIKSIEDLTDAYIAQTGEIPDSEQLTRLANYILQDDFSERLPDKVSCTEYPILSRGQYKLRLRREKASGEMANHTRCKKPGKSRKKILREAF
ncbi:hypothetical protein Dtox_1887 [Desulfofarcimen acetoxidans DSM 771]|uniref:Uncharacterized protein n=1 Tax=Desulfofarcimen acetoxidans (strain ATCC 49208 / DSM 771 / KCTC 5769 / VKM B-1644 / 5575) TaxID=485916 RepID=C8VXS7_DESAS|nr:hypothetical protein [Desulfofarcimen acetoxidans]ACV62733.1 hypothetical protein Dtox_1887 [Desulfofarcimen acetoxidans DSM 771]